MSKVLQTERETPSSTLGKGGLRKKDRDSHRRVIHAIRARQRSGMRAWHIRASNSPKRPLRHAWVSLAQTPPWQSETVASAPFIRDVSASQSEPSRRHRSLEPCRRTILHATPSSACSMTARVGLWTRWAAIVNLGQMDEMDGRHVVFRSTVVFTSCSSLLCRTQPFRESYHTLFLLDLCSI